MEEKILISSKSFKIKWVAIILFITSLLIYFIAIPSNVYSNLTNLPKYERDHYVCDLFMYRYGKDICIHEYPYADKFVTAHPNIFSFLGCHYSSYGIFFDYALTESILSLSLSLIAILIYFSFTKYSITVTDKRVYGKKLFGLRVDLPIDSISSVGTDILCGINIGTSSGKIRFKFIKNKDEIHSLLSKLIIERQQVLQAEKQHETNPNTSNADELKKFKDLLDSGIITQEEFDAKKKQLLEL